LNEKEINQMKTIEEIKTQIGKMIENTEEIHTPGLRLVLRNKELIFLALVKCNPSDTIIMHLNSEHFYYGLSSAEYNYAANRILNALKRRNRNADPKKKRQRKPKVLFRWPVKCL